MTEKSKHEARQLVWHAKHRATKIRPKAVGGGIFEVDGVISSDAEDYVGMNFSVNFEDSASNRSRDIRAAQFVTDERTTADGPCSNRAKRHGMFSVHLRRTVAI